MRVLRAYALATVSVTLALLLTLFVPLLRDHFKFLLFFLAVFASAIGGVGPGAFATLLSVVMAHYFLLPPLRSFSISDPGEELRVLLFCSAAFTVTWITQRVKRSEEMIRAAAAVVESSADSIMLQGLDNMILSWNKSAENIYGYTAQEAIGRPVSLIVPPDHREELQRLVERIHQGGSVQSHETVRIRKDGAYIDIALTLSPVQDRKGRTIGVSSIAREITGRKRTEEELRQSHEKLERQTDQLRLLAEMSELFHASSVPADAYKVTTRFAQALIPGSSGALFVSSASTNNLEAVIRWGEPHANEPEFLAYDECWALRLGRLHLVEDPKYRFALPPSARASADLLPLCPDDCPWRDSWHAPLADEPAKSRLIRCSAPEATGIKMARREHGRAAGLGIGRYEIARDLARTVHLRPTHRLV